MRTRRDLLTAVCVTQLKVLKPRQRVGVTGDAILCVIKLDVLFGSSILKLLENISGHVVNHGGTLPRV